jgi:hypothetical protein
MTTYNGQSPANIRSGDLVTDALSRTFWALSDAAEDHGDYVVTAELMDGERKGLILDKDSLVTITYDEPVEAFSSPDAF